LIALCVWAVRKAGRLVFVRNRKPPAADRAD
jgi:hypothetical protein